AVVGGFAAAGSPFKQRLVRFDEQKVWDLQSIQGQVVNHWQKKQALPPDLEALRDDISGFVPPKDSQSEAAYEYRALGALSFELCANFNLSSEEQAGVGRLLVPPKGFEAWEHPQGRHCFKRTIDPDLYDIDKSDRIPVVPSPR
ncbi:hypothetical protein C4587_00175, partial [Candidatus Parcubacteria bacterium]